MENIEITALPDDETDAPTGLRGRKKARRREDIIAAARMLFAKQGIDATSMADIANEVGISQPTVFNYFGSKDGILIALIAEGTAAARQMDRNLPRLEGADLPTLIVNLLVRVSRRTLEIGGKRIWRYAEAANIRYPQTELATEYASVSRRLKTAIVEFFAEYDLRLHTGDACPNDYIAGVFLDLWMPCFIELIKDDDMGLEEHERALREQLLPITKLLFDAESLRNPLLKES